MKPPEQIDVGGAARGTRTREYDLVEVAAAMRSLSQRVTDGGSDGGPFERLVLVAVERVPGVRWASVGLLRGGSFTTAASTGDGAVLADLLQSEIGCGPYLDAVLKDSLCVTGDVCSDPRWSDWGRRVNAELGVNSVLAARLQLQGESVVVAGLNLYSDEYDAFDWEAAAVASILAAHAGLALSESLATHRAANLSRALQSNREIGVAMGILMHHHRLSREEAFDALRVASQSSNRRLADIAAEVADTGTLGV